MAAPWIAAVPQSLLRNWFMSQRRALSSFGMFRDLIIQDMFGRESFLHCGIISRIQDDAKIDTELLLRLGLYFSG